VRRHNLHALFLLLLGVAVAGCGWHLRGTGANSLSQRIASIAVEDPGVYDVGVQVRILLRRSGVPTVGLASAELVLSLSRERFDNRVLSVDPDTGKVREYEVGYEIMLSLRRRDGTLIIAPEALELQRDYTFDETAVLGEFVQVTTLRREIREEAAESIVRRIEAADLSR
jgi:LPS-assembly lipoprotein